MRTALKVFAHHFPALALVLLLALMLSQPSRIAQAADSLFPPTMQSHYLPLASVPTATTTVYSTAVWLKSIELVPQSTTSPTCTVQDGSGNYLYHAIQLQPNISYRDTRQDTAPLYAAGGITWSCSDTTVKAQLIVMY